MPVVPWSLIASFFLGLLLLYLVGYLLLVPMRFLWRLMAGSCLGALALWMVNQFGYLTHLSVPINPLTALIAGFLGLPGVALVVALTLLL
ncbi:MAG: pro-sigmaK processing inhibitor BofA [Clostridiales bacterium]|nr:pro-sigmaK processing inhibitor BofA [Clostridiales bacterium]